MGRRRKKTTGLGRSIINDRFQDQRTIAGKKSDSWLHTSELNDGYDWGRLNLQSVTEESNLSEFLAIADLAGTEFTAERLNVKVVDPSQHSGLPSATEAMAIEQAHQENKQSIKIPRRPKWDSSTTPEELVQMERDSFLHWRRHIASLQEKEHVLLTPFERNLDFWRQLWRVIEKSDVVVQIVDARNPLLFRCEDLEKYVKEVDENKENLILVNKADLLNEQQRQAWADYFAGIGVRVVFWSATLETEMFKLQDDDDDLNAEQDSGDDYSNDDDDDSDDENYEDDDEIGDDDSDAIEDEEAVVVEHADNKLVDDVIEEGTRDKGASGGHDALCASFDESRDATKLSKSAEDDAEYVKENCKDGGEDIINSEDGNLDNDVQTTVDTTQRNLCDSDAAAGLSSVGICKLPVDSPNSRTKDFETHNQQEALEKERSVHFQETDQNSGFVASVAHGGDEETVARATTCVVASDDADSRTESGGSEIVENDATLLGGDELLEVFKSFHKGKKVNEEITTVGLVGYPNVGKSSTINALLHTKKVPVSTTPGRTKHFQTLFVEPKLCLCDCPGLVMPSLVSTKASMVINGILPIDQMRDHIPPVSLVCQHIPRDVLEATYGINIIKPREGEDPNRPPTAHELLMAHGYIRGFMTQRGVPDTSRSARYILKDYVKGKLHYCHTPPGMDELSFQEFVVSQRKEQDSGMKSNQTKSENNPTVITVDGIRRKQQSSFGDVDKAFFSHQNIHACSKGVQGIVGYTRRVDLARHVGTGSQNPDGQSGSQASIAEKPWKRHHNKKKKEKLRKVHRHLDEC